MTLNRVVRTVRTTVQPNSNNATTCGSRMLNASASAHNPKFCSPSRSKRRSGSCTVDESDKAQMGSSLVGEKIEVEDEA